MYDQMVSWGCFQASPNGTTYEQSMADAATGKTLGVVQLPSSIGAATGAPAGTTWNMAPFPATNDASQTVMPSAVITVYMLNAKSAKKTAAVDFLNFLASGTAIKIQAKAGDAIPAIPVAGYKATSPAVQTVIDYRTKGDTYPFIDNLWPNAKVESVMISQIQSLIGGSTTPKGVTQQMDTAFKG
jgi:raffinose/stachyose/melibiose transport system substrate-binding protein